MDELKMTGNCLKGSRPIISFDSSFNTPCMELIKEILTHTFSTPKTSRKIKPFIDHVMQFSNCDGKIWVRHFQIKISIGDNNKEEINLVEIGPRFVLSVIRVFDGSFGGKTLFENDEYVSPNTVRRDAKEAKSDRYDRRAGATKDYDLKMSQIKNLPRDEANDVFI